LRKLASLSLAGSWDNVGLLVEPSAPHKVSTVFLTNDLTPPVLDEAIKQNSDMIISYHPPIFSGMKKLVQKQWKDKIIIRCIKNKILLFIRPKYKLKICVEAEQKPVIEGRHLKKPNNKLKLQKCRERSDGKHHLSVHCTKSSLKRVMSILQDKMESVKNLQITNLEKAPTLGYGMGRKAKLNKSISLDEAVQLVKKHLKLDHVRLAKSPGVEAVSSVAVCAGSGGSVLRNVTADLYVTGEMSHHEVLHAVYNNSAVILCDHSNTERGYLTVLKI
ncbi:NIF3-like protein 1, partial [Ruditapes philippinarum]|uniref:NIF3-like protein 1 n=1 Tax=Ruditapes philippinarum TaxID=129788 RepID=UPI00295BA153